MTTRPKKIEWRASGILELICSHECGHPIFIPSRLKGQSYELHGCDGCCGMAIFKKDEAYILKRLFTKKGYKGMKIKQFAGAG